ncbi:hypothetical protein BLOT_008537 [Blomia tropicalis]|nr:hypothetical protein BLOT_008537 [Blomia tropicalis]
MLALKDFKKKVGRKVNHAIKGKFASGSFLNETVEEAGSNKEKFIENDICFFDLQKERVNQKFEVSELVLCGSGAFGTVFSCYATKNGEKTFEQLAIKVIRAESLATSSLKKWKRRSKREMYYLHKLEHENIVKLHDYLWLNNPEKKHFPAYLAMKFEYLETDLEKMAKKMRTFSVDLLIPIAKQIGSAIAYMHSKKIINHDIKPANIMVEKLEQNGNIGANSVYKLIDFGLARHTDHPLGSEAKCDKFMGGTLIFTCPEKIGRNKKREYDLYLSDSYSFGATLFSLLFGYNEYVTRMRNMNPGDLFMQYLNVAWEFEITHPYFFSIIGHLLTHQFRRKYVKDILEMLENPEQHPIDYYFYKPPDGCAFYALFCMQGINQTFEVSELVLCGSGAFGTVFSCFATKNGEKTFQKYAIKVIRAESLATSTLKKWKRR